LQKWSHLVAGKNTGKMVIAGSLVKMTVRDKQHTTGLRAKGLAMNFSVEHELLYHIDEPVT
jgi:hypothetical protein